MVNKIWKRYNMLNSNQHSYRLKLCIIKKYDWPIRLIGCFMSQIKKLTKFCYNWINYKFINFFFVMNVRKFLSRTFVFSWHIFVLSNILQTIHLFIQTAYSKILAKIFKLTLFISITCFSFWFCINYFKLSIFKQKLCFNIILKYNWFIIFIFI